MNSQANGRLDCPFCRKRTAFVKLHETHNQTGHDQMVEVNVDTENAAEEIDVEVCSQIPGKVV